MKDLGLISHQVFRERLGVSFFEVAMSDSFLIRIFAARKRTPPT